MSNENDVKDDEITADNDATPTEGSAPEPVAGPSLEASPQDVSPDVSPDMTPDEAAAEESSWTGDALPEYTASAPNITQLKPMRVDSRGGTPVTVFGAGFVPGCRVLAGNDECITEFIDPFTLRFAAPALEGPGPEGTCSVIVEAPSGKRSPEPGILYFTVGPTILRCIPEEGPTEGGIEVVLEGTNFSSGMVVSLFGEHAPDCVFENPGRMTFVLPAVGVALEGPLVVTALDGLMGRSDTAFRYRPLVPRIDEIDPPHGWINGGKVVAVRGKDFHRNAKAKIGGVAANVVFRTQTHVDVEVPPREEPCICDLELENPDKRRAVSMDGFEYRPVPAPPKLLDIIPPSGPTTGGTTIRISGDNFREDVIVRIGELTAVRRVVSAKLVDVDLPARQLPGKVAVEFVQDGVSVRVEEAFTYISPQVPKITTVEPRTGSTAGGTRVVLEGEDFPSNASVRFGSEFAKTVSVRGTTRIEVVTPPVRSAGVVDIVVSSPDRGDGVAAKGFRFDAAPAPVITVVSPAKGTVDGNTELSIEGKNFAEGVAVLVGGFPVKRVKRISGSVLEAFTPGGEDGKLVDVVVKNPDGQQAIQKRAFQYDARYRS